MTCLVPNRKLIFPIHVPSSLSQSPVLMAYTLGIELATGTPRLDT